MDDAASSKNDASITRLAFHALFELLNSLSVLLSFILECVSIVIHLSNGSWKRQTDNGAVSNFDPKACLWGLSALGPLLFSMESLALCCAVALVALWCCSAFGVFALCALALWPFGPFGPLAPQPLWPFWPWALALWPFVLWPFDPFGSLALCFLTLAFWPFSLAWFSPLSWPAFGPWAHAPWPCWLALLALSLVLCLPLLFKGLTLAWGLCFCPLALFWFWSCAVGPSGVLSLLCFSCFSPALVSLGVSRARAARRT